MFALSLLVLLFLPASAPPQAQPPVPFYDWGGCPFEGCTYRRWEAGKPVTVWTGRDRRHVAFTIKPKEWAHGINGVVITTRPGVSKVLIKMTLGNKAQVELAPGDLLYTLHYLGEGYDLFWFRGKTYSDQISGDPDPDPPPPGTEIQIISRPEYVWWVKVRNAKGQVGWTDQTDRFTNMDQFASWRVPYFRQTQPVEHRDHWH